MITIENQNVFGKVIAGALVSIERAEMTDCNKKRHINAVAKGAARIQTAGVFMVLIAALESLDNQTFCEAAEDFERFIEATQSVPLFNDDFEIEKLSQAGLPIYKSFDLYVYTHKGKWMRGNATPFWNLHGFLTSLLVVWEGQIEGGTSGGPVVNEFGLLVGVVSRAAGRTGSNLPMDCVDILASCLPPRVLHRIQSNSY